MDENTKAIVEAASNIISSEISKTDERFSFSKLPKKELKRIVNASVDLAILVVDRVKVKVGSA